MFPAPKHEPNWNFKLKVVTYDHLSKLLASFSLKLLFIRSSLPFVQFLSGQWIIFLVWEIFFFFFSAKILFVDISEREKREWHETWWIFELFVASVAAAAWCWRLKICSSVTFLCFVLDSQQDISLARQHDNERRRVMSFYVCLFTMSTLRHVHLTYSSWRRQQFTFRGLKMKVKKKFLTRYTTYCQFERRARWKIRKVFVKVNWQEARMTHIYQLLPWKNYIFCEIISLSIKKSFFFVDSTHTSDVKQSKIVDIKFIFNFLFKEFPSQFWKKIFA